MNDFSIDEHQGIFENTHDDRACAALKAYDTQCNYSDGSLKPAKYRKTMRDFEQITGIPVDELKKHWRCIEDE